MANKADTQAKAAELGIEFDDSTTVKDLETKIAEKEAENAAGNPPVPPTDPVVPTPPTEPTPPTPPSPPAGKAEPEFDVQLEAGAEFQVIRSVDGKFARIFDKFKRAISPIVDATNYEEVEKLGRECTRHNALAMQRNPRKK